MTAPTTSPVPPTGLAGISRGDGVTAVAALLVFVCSFLPQVAAGRSGAHMWHGLALVEIFAVPLLALVVLASTLLPLQRPDLAHAELLGVPPAAWRTVLSLVVAVAGIFAIFFWHQVAQGGAHIGYGAYLVLVFGLATAAGTIAPPYVPALRLPVMTPRAPKPPAPEPSGVAGWQPPAGAEQGYAPAGFDPVPEAAPPPSPPEPAADAPPPPFEPFWACFPTVRPLVDRANTALTIGQVSPEEWYLVTALDEQGASISTSDGRSGLLLDTSGLIRADR